MSALLPILEEHGLAMSQRVLAAMYRDPFWSERYGERGRRHADEDSAFHLQYLARAMSTGDATVMVRYARWLRELLASRGMCTRHLAENFRLLGQGLAESGWPDAAQAVAHLRTARAGLDYAEGGAAAVQALIRDVDSTAQDYSESPDIYLSYLADALAFGSPATFLAHVRWTRDWLQTAARSTAGMDAALAEAGQRLGGDARFAEARAWLEEATSLAEQTR